MKCSFMSSVVLLSIVALAASAQELDLKVERSVLDNGLTLLLAPDSTTTTVSVFTFVNAGSRDEDRAGITGLAHVFEHMMFRGTKRFPDYAASTAPLGAETNAYTSADYTAYFINAESQHLEKMLELEADRIRNLIFTNETFRTELGPVKEERRRGVDDDPEGFLEVELGRLAFTTHTYQHPVIGWEEDLETRMTFEDGLQFKNRFYVPNNCVLVIAGNFQVEQARQLVQRFYADWKRGEAYVPLIRPEPRQDELRAKDFVWKDDQIAPLLRIGFHAPAPRQDFAAVAALQLINHLLFSKSGRLTQRLKNDLALVESVFGNLELGKDPSLQTISVRLKRGATFEQVRDTIFHHLQLLATEPVSPEELDRARNNLRAQMIYRLDRPSSVASSLGHYHLLTGDYRGMMELYRLYATVTAEKLQKVAEEVFRDGNRTIVSLIPKSSI